MVDGLSDEDPGTRRPRAEEVRETEAALGDDMPAADRAAAAALRAAAASIQGELTPRAYDGFRRGDADRWPSVEEIEERFGSFASALSRAGIGRPSRA